LVEVLDAHPELRILNEPFNENFTSWQAGNPNYRDRLVDRDGLDGVLADVFATYSGFKTLSFQVLGALLESLLLRSDLDVVVLRRRNLHEAVVSNLIAQQTNLWKTWSGPTPPHSRCCTSSLATPIVIPSLSSGPMTGRGVGLPESLEMPCKLSWIAGKRVSFVWRTSIPRGWWSW
jgi:hypothetical protein